MKVKPSLKFLPSAEIDQKTERTLKKAVTQLIIKHPFYGTMLLNSNLLYTRSIPVAGTDGIDIAINPDIFSKLDTQETMFILAHEVLHKVFMHTFRLAERDPRLWNYSTDLIINDMLVHDGMVMPHIGGLHDTNIATKDDLTDTIYNKLSKNKPDENSGDSSEDNPDHLHDPGSFGGGDPTKQNQQMSPAELKAAANEVKTQIGKAVALAKEQGKLPGTLKQLVDGLLKPQIDWKAKLREFCTERAKLDYSWRRPNKRTMAHDLYLPHIDGQVMRPPFLGFDTSGSITWGTGALQQFLSEFNKIREDLEPEKIYTAQCDTQIRHTQEYEAHDPLTFEIHGGGGTTLDDLFTHAQTLQFDISCAIIFTDGYVETSRWQDPGVPVLVISWQNQDFQSPFGETVYIS